MANTLGLFNLHTLPNKSHKIVSEIPNLSKSKPNRTHHLPKQHSNTSPKLFQQTIHQLKSHSLPLTVFTLPFLLDPQDALAVGGEFGLLEGGTFALIHPIVMGGLFFYTLWAGYLGWQWRRIRTIQNEVNELKKQVKTAVPALEGASSLEATTSVSPVETKIQQLTEERKELLKGSYRDRHFNAGSILLGFGVFEAVGGGVNTWFRTGKLFPGPHLFAGAGP